MATSVAAKRWAALVAAADRSELSYSEFARRRGVNPSTLAWWRWRLRQLQPEDQDPAFVEVVLAADLRPAFETLRVHLRGGAYVDVGRDSDLLLFRQVVDVLS